ncbi:MAG: von Willebrand factor type A domain-containing protein [Planctomycetota bacterium]
MTSDANEFDHERASDELAASDGGSALRDDSHLQYLLTAYLFDNISEPGRVEVEQHLAECSDCRAELDELRGLHELLDDALADAGEAPYSFEARRLERVLAYARVRRQHRWSFTRASGWRRVAAICLITVFGGVLFLALVTQSSYRAAPEMAWYSSDDARVKSATTAEPVEGQRHVVDDKRSKKAADEYRKRDAEAKGSFGLLHGSEGVPDADALRDSLRREAVFDQNAPAARKPVDADLGGLVDTHDADAPRPGSEELRGWSMGIAHNARVDTGVPVPGGSGGGGGGVGHKSPAKTEQPGYDLIVTNSTAFEVQNFEEPTPELSADSISFAYVGPAGGAQPPGTSSPPIVYGNPRDLVNKDLFKNRTNLVQNGIDPTVPRPTEAPPTLALQPGTALGEEQRRTRLFDSAKGRLVRDEVEKSVAPPADNLAQLQDKSEVIGSGIVAKESLEVYADEVYPSEVYPSEGGDEDADEIAETVVADPSHSTRTGSQTAQGRDYVRGSADDPVVQKLQGELYELQQGSDDGRVAKMAELEKQLWIRRNRESQAKRRIPNLEQEIIRREEDRRAQLEQRSGELASGPHFRRGYAWPQQPTAPKLKNPAFFDDASRRLESNDSKGPVAAARPETKAKAGEVLASNLRAGRRSDSERTNSLGLPPLSSRGEATKPRAATTFGGVREDRSAAPQSLIDRLAAASDRQVADSGRAAGAAGQSVPDRSRALGRFEELARYKKLREQDRSHVDRSDPVVAESRENATGQALTRPSPTRKRPAPPKVASDEQSKSVLGYSVGGDKGAVALGDGEIWIAGGTGDVILSNPEDSPIELQTASEELADELAPELAPKNESVVGKNAPKNTVRLWRADDKGAPSRTLSAPESYHTWVQVPGADGMINTADDRVVVAGGGENWLATGNSPTVANRQRVSGQIFLPPSARPAEGADFAGEAGEVDEENDAEVVRRFGAFAGGDRVPDLHAGVALPPTWERALRGYRHYSQLDPHLTIDGFLTHPVSPPAPAVGDEGLGRDGFRAKYGVNPFVDTRVDQLSTFAMDVDTASYTRARTLLRQGQLPPADTVRVEEFVNAFPFPEVPDPQEVFSVFCDGGPSPFGADVELLRVTVKARELHESERRPLILTLAIDTSGSMFLEQRLDVVKDSLDELLRELAPDDQVGVVAYGSQAYLALPHTPARERARIAAALDTLTPRGNTNVEAGLDLAYRVADELFNPKAMHRVILCSDGVATTGEQDREPLDEMVRVFADRGIYLSVLGFGRNRYNDQFLEQLANRGNGNYAYVEDAARAAQFFRRHLPQLLEVLARDAKIQVDFEPSVVSHYRLLGYENRDVADVDFRNDAVDAGEVGPGSTVTALYEVKRHPQSVGPLGRVFVRFHNTTTQQVEERDFPVVPGVLATNAEASSEPLRFLACVAEFAELLRGSYWSQDGSYEEIKRVLSKMSEPFRASDAWQELAQLIVAAQRLTIAEMLQQQR